MRLPQGFEEIFGPAPHPKDYHSDGLTFIDWQQAKTEWETELRDFRGFVGGPEMLPDRIADFLELFGLEPSGFRAYSNIWGEGVAFVLNPILSKTQHRKRPWRFDPQANFKESPLDWTLDEGAVHRIVKAYQTTAVDAGVHVAELHPQLKGGALERANRELGLRDVESA